MHLTLPREYPSRSNPIATCNAPNLSKDQHHLLQTALNDRLEEMSSSTEERIFEIVEFFADCIPEHPPFPETAGVHTEKIESSSTTSTVLIWFHHLLSTRKRKDILALSTVRGISKPGYPGILVLQGAKHNVNDAITELKGMRWQAIQVRAELEDHDTLLDDRIHEVESIAQVVEQMERIGLGDWCLGALRVK